MKRIILILPLAFVTACAWAESPKRSVVYYSAEAKRDHPGFVADRERGRSFATRNWGVSESHTSCAACHTDRPGKPGRHAITGKPIAALSPAVTPGRFSNPAKLEKRFRRDCKDVLGRRCTAAEKADFVLFVMLDPAP